MLISEAATETISVEHSEVCFISMICVLRHQVQRGSVCARAAAMQIGVTAVGPNPQSRGFSRADLLSRTRACTQAHTNTHSCLNNHSLQANSRLAETVINDDLCDPVSVQRKFTFPPDTSWHFIHIIFIIESWLSLYIWENSDSVE